MCVPRGAGPGRRKAALRQRRDLRLETGQRKRETQRLHSFVVVVVYSLHCTWLNGRSIGKHVPAHARWDGGVLPGRQWTSASQQPSFAPGLGGRVTDRRTAEVSCKSQSLAKLDRSHLFLVKRKKRKPVFREGRGLVSRGTSSRGLQPPNPGLPAPYGRCKTAGSPQHRGQVSSSRRGNIFVIELPL